MSKSPSDSLALAALCCRALEEKKAGAVRVLEVKELSSITNYLIIATGTSEPHLRALRVELEKALDAAHARIVGRETGQGSGWLVIDAFDVMVHLFLSAQREHYGLENLWKDAPEIPVAELLAEPARKAARAKPAKARKARSATAGKSKPAAKARSRRSHAGGKAG